MIKGMALGGTLFEELGFSYVGSIDGHDWTSFCRCCARCMTAPRGRC